jgi:hypothetical protein
LEHSLTPAEQELTNRPVSAGYASSLLRCAHKKSRKTDRKAIFYPANRIEPKVRSTPDNRDFALLMAQKSTSATGCQRAAFGASLRLPSKIYRKNIPKK